VILRHAHFLLTLILSLSKDEPPELAEGKGEDIEGGGNALLRMRKL
jgi:hypothetical protein